ncbi:MAG: OB-fold nucleic acid binding domain-containing protein [Nanoarchaeota archaeon]
MNKFNEKKVNKEFQNNKPRKFSEHKPFMDGSFKTKVFNELQKEDVGFRNLTFTAKIEEVKQTSGPTIFTLYDGSSTIKATGFISPGKRAFPEVDIEDVVTLTASVSERDNSLELEIKTIKKLEGKEREDVITKINSLEEEKSKPDNVQFLVDSEVLRKLKPRIIKVASEIKKAIYSNRPIILKHHNDCDGYSSGIALERAILPLIREHHISDSAERLYFKRTPSTAPFYEYTDAVKDISSFIDDFNKFGQKPPLIVVTDNGSTEEDLLSIKAVKIYGADVVVIDHHYPGELVDGKVAVDEYLSAHVNPYLEGFDSTMCAGILCTEVARFVNKDAPNIEHIPGIAATADRVEGSVIEKYKELTRKYGYTDEDMKILSEIIDFQSYYLRFMEARGFVNSLFGEGDFKRQKELMHLIGKEIQRRNEISLNAARHFMNLEEQEERLIMTLDANKVTSRGEFPAIGKTVGMTHDSLKKEYPGKAIISMGLGPDFVTLRLTDNSGFSVNTIVKILQEKIPHGNIDGGGHECAGSIKFFEAAREEVHRILFAILRGEDY